MARCAGRIAIIARRSHVILLRIEVCAGTGGYDLLLRRGEGTKHGG